MTKLEELIDAIDRSEILYIEAFSELQPAKTMRTEQGCAIFFNERAFQTDAARLVALAHEKGHCDTGAFYTINTPLETRGRCEARAWQQAIIDLIPFHKLMQAIEACKTVDGVALYDLAEYMDVTPEFVHRAVELYAHIGQQVLSCS